MMRKGVVLGPQCQTSGQWLRATRVRYGFTLIELLIVAAIITILALIGLANMLQATVRSKVARTKNDMRVIAGALEAYHVDNNEYISFISGGPGSLFSRVIVPMTKRLSPLTTPIAYITRVPIDVFQTVATSDGSPLIFFDTFDYADVAGLNAAGSPKGAGGTSGGWWRLSSAGPDLIQSYGGDIAEIGSNSIINNFGVDYDPTNGSISAGDIVRVGPPSDQGQLPAIRRAAGRYEELFRNYSTPGSPP
jgi:prepilin-type N-terminal cleavage/methylation domain-containing protein